MELTSAAGAAIGNVPVDYNGRTIGGIEAGDNVFAKLGEIMARSVPGIKNVTIYAQSAVGEREINDKVEIDQTLSNYVANYGRVERFRVTASTIPSGAL